MESTEGREREAATPPPQPPPPPITTTTAISTILTDVTRQIRRTRIQSRKSNKKHVKIAISGKASGTTSFLARRHWDEKKTP